MLPNGSPAQRTCVVCGIIGAYDEYDWRQCSICMWWVCTADCIQIHDEEEFTLAEHEAEAA